MKILMSAFLAAIVSVSAQAQFQNQAAPLKTVSGKVSTVVASIGGEGTGFEIELEDGRSVEADFSQIPGGAPAEGTEIRAQGRFTTVVTPERGAHKVFVVAFLQPPGRVSSPATSLNAAAAADAPKSLQITGTITGVAGIGGESTGTAIQTPTGLVEADFSRLRLGSRLPQGQLVQATGEFKIVMGVERASRQIFVVKFFLQQFEGTLLSVAGIGGESTGTGLRLKNNQIVELDLRQRRLQSFFREGARVQVAGMFKSVPGVEIPMRDVLIVSTITGLR